MEFSVAGTVPKDVGERDRQFKGPRYIHRGRPLKFPKLEEIPHTLLSPAVKPISASATSSSSKDKRESTRKSGRKKVQTADQTNALNLAEPNKIDDIDLKLFGNDEFHNIPGFICDLIGYGLTFFPIFIIYSVWKYLTLV
jgi:hypothetical protein